VPTVPPCRQGSCLPKHQDQGYHPAQKIEVVACYDAASSRQGFQYSRLEELILEIFFRLPVAQFNGKREIRNEERKFSKQMVAEASSFAYHQFSIRQRFSAFIESTGFFDRANNDE
jgi:hypothetical protein